MNVEGTLGASSVRLLKAGEVSAETGLVRGGERQQLSLEFVPDPVAFVELGRIVLAQFAADPIRQQRALRRGRWSSSSGSIRPKSSWS